MGQRKNLITSCRGLRFFLCPTLVTCWSFHFHIYFTELKIYHLSFFQNKHFWNISGVHGFAGLTVIQWSLSFGTLPLLKGHLYSGKRTLFLTPEFNLHSGDTLVLKKCLTTKRVDICRCALIITCKLTQTELSHLSQWNLLVSEFNIIMSQR